MAFLCPLCGHSISLKDPKPGKYKPKCPKCSGRFGLTVSSDPAILPLAEKLPVDEAAVTMQATLVPPTPPPAPAKASAVPPSAQATFAPAMEATLPPTATTPVDPNATGAWQAPPPAKPTPASEATLPQRAMDATSMGTVSNATRADQPVKRPSALPAGVPPTIGGYRILKELGRGAMGSVFLAKQVSLDRDVALKTIQSQWADNPTFIARFTREAYAAAQLTHHNVVQIYDLGEENGTNYFSMEFVRGESLDDLLKRDGKLDVEVAVGYVLQAARGLQFAHNHGMVHRDVKPANLMLNDLGVVKVADLGLVKTPNMNEAEVPGDPNSAPAIVHGMSGSLAASTADVTMVNMAMGTPAYMAPEQGTNASGVDHRADIYSLGCTLYVLLTGRPPFEGATAMEVITKHKTEPVIRPEAIVARVPPQLSEITLKMVAKKREDRYSNLAEVIAALENFLGIQTSGAFSPKEEHAQILEQAQTQFNGASFSKLKAIIPLAFAAGVLAVAALLLALFKLTLAGGMLALGLAAVVTYFVVSGLRDKSFLFDKVRAYLFTARISDWLTWGAGGLVLVLALFVLNALWVWLGLAIVGALLGLAFYAVVDGRLTAQRAAPVEHAEQLLKSLRLKGIDEGALRQFVAKYSSQHWEEFFETLFGYEAKLSAREKFSRTDNGKSRPKFRPWRDTLIRWIDDRLRVQREEKDRQHIQKVEEKGLQAQGVDIVQARKQAQAMAAAQLDEAAAAREAAKSGKAVSGDPAVIAAEKRARTKALLADAKRGAYQAKRQRLVGLAFSPLTFVLGGKVRFLVGCALLACFALWAKQNNIFAGIQRTVQSVSQATSSVESAGDASKQIADQMAKTSESAKPLPIPFGRLVSGFPAAAAGLLLLFLGLFQGWKMSLFALPAAAIMLLGTSLGIPGGATVCVGIGAAIGIIGFFFGKTYDD